MYEATGSDPSWRWFGGVTAEATLFIQTDLTGADTAVFTGDPMVSDEITADVYFGGEKTDHVAFGARDGPDAYRLNLAPK